jgi:riboflavin synthase
MERALKIDSRLGGHFVTGHVDGVGKIITKNKNGDFIEMEIEIATHLMKYLAQKGSVAVDGISLTIAAVAENTFRVILIPHTISVTTLAYKKAADIVNIETDILAKYVQQAINPSLEQSASKKYRPITRELLLDYGFIPPANTQD